MRWSCGALGRVPRLAQRRVILFFCPILASRRTRPPWRRARRPSRGRSRPARRGRCFEKSDRPFGLGMVARAGGELAPAHGAQFAAQRLLGDADPELLPQPPAQVDETPPHHAVHRRDRAALERRRQRRPVGVAQPRRLARSLAVDQPLRAMGIELQHPVPDDLPRHAADPRRLGPRRSVVDGGHRQKAPRLRGILRPSCRRTQTRRVEIAPERDGHGEPPPFAISNQKTEARGIPRESPSLGFGITALPGTGRPRVKPFTAGHGGKAAGAAGAAPPGSRSTNSDTGRVECPVM